MELGGWVVGGGLSLNIKKGGVQLSRVFFTYLYKKQHSIFFTDFKKRTRMVLPAFQNFTSQVLYLTNSEF